MKKIQILKTVFCVFLAPVVMSCSTPTSTNPTDPTEEVMKMQTIVLKVSTDVAHALHRRVPPNNESDELLKIVEMFDVTLRPMHPGVEDRNLIRYFIVKAPDFTIAQLLLERLQQSKVVEAAYIKQPDELP